MRSARWRATFAVLTAAVAMLVSSSALAQQAVARGQLGVLGLRAPDGEDDVAAQATAAFRTAARAAGFDVPETTQSLEQLVAAFSCDDAVPEACLQQISTEVRVRRFLYGSVRRAGRGRTAPLRIEVRVYDAQAHSSTAPQQQEFARADVATAAALEAPATTMINTLVPPPAATTTVGGGGGIALPPPVTVTPGPPIRRYIGLAAIGIGAAAMIGGGIAGGLWLGHNASGNPSNGVEPTDPDARAYYNYFPAALSNEQVTNGSLVCDAARTEAATPMRSVNAEGANRFCQRSASLIATEFVLLGIGAAVAVAGVILVVTDRTGSETASTTSTTTTAHERSRRALRPTWALSPVINTATQGAIFNLNF